jgi:hypothetical protein
MLTSADLLRDGKPVAEAIAAAAPAPAALAEALAGAAGDHLAALCLVAAGQPAAAAPVLVPALLPHLGADGWAGKAAAHALARLAPVEALAAVIPEGDLDTRENAYAALAGRIALQGGDAALADRLAGFVEAEIARAKAGRTSLAEHALRALAVLGDRRVGDLAQAIIEADRFCDRFEVNRIRKTAGDGRDGETRSALLAPWAEQYADHLYTAPVAKAPEPAPAKPAPAAKAPMGAGPRGPLAPPMRSAPAAKAPAPAPVPPPMADEAEDDAGLPPEGAAGEPAAIDWAAFAGSPQAAALKPTEKQIVTQVGPLLEELAARAIGIPLTEASDQEVVALMLQVLPQALPPQHVQAVLSPQSLNGLSAVAAWLGPAGDQLAAGIKLIRTQMQAQMRRAGIINGPDYSEPAPPAG